MDASAVPLSTSQKLEKAKSLALTSLRKPRSKSSSFGIA
jgi:hypothetical protein